MQGCRSGMPGGRATSLALAYAGLAGILDTAFLLGVVSAYALKLGADEVEASIAAGAYGMVALPASIAAAIAVERLGSRRALTLGLSWDALSVAAYGFASSVGQLIALRGIHALGGSLVYPAYLAAAGRRAEATGRAGVVIAGYLAVVGAVVGLGALAGAAALAALGFKGLFIILSILIALGALAAAASGVDYRPPVEGIARGLAAAGRQVASGLAVIFLLYIGFGLLVGGLAPGLEKEGLVGSEEEAGVLANTAVGVASLVGSAFMIAAGAAADRGLLHIVAPASGLAGAAALYLSPGAEGAGLALLFAVYGLAVGGLLFASSYLVLQSKAKGAAAGLQQLVNIAGVALGAPAAGGILRAYGLEGLLAAAALATAAAGLTAVPGALAARRPSP